MSWLSGGSSRQHALGLGVVQSLVLATCPLWPSAVIADVGHEHPEPLFAVTYVSAILLGLLVAGFVIVRLQRRARNPHTGLRRPLKARRARGPLSLRPRR